ncbi:unnamed protein product [Alopecurus aequalis]
MAAVSTSSVALLAVVFLAVFASAMASGRMMEEVFALGSRAPSLAPAPAPAPMPSAAGAVAPGAWAVAVVVSLLAFLAH